MKTNPQAQLDGPILNKLKDDALLKKESLQRWGQSALLNSLMISSLAVVATANSASANTLEQLKGFSLSQLADLEVSIAGKAPQKTREVAAAISVLTQEDIRRSGASTIPDLLRLVPGLQVARIDAHNWVVSSRGFGDRVTNKLLVMIDGRSIYSHVFSGVFWDQHDVVLEDIERIEVIRGPGASVWGANAVNGVINIITRSALDTQGTTAVTATAGNEGGYTSLRTSGALGEDGAYRAYGKYRNQDDAVFADGSRAADGWDDWRTGFRMDWRGDNDTHVTLQGDLHRGDFSERIRVLDFAPPFSVPRNDNIDAWGHNLLARWSTTLSDGGHSELQAYYDKQQRDQWTLEESTSTYDINYNYRFPHLGTHRLITGAGYRYIDNSLPTGDLSIGQVRIFTPEHRDDELFSFFVQDEVELLSDTLWLTLGVKLEENDYSGFEYQPNLRLRWAFNEGHMLWAAVSRAVRTPSRAEHDGFMALDIINTGPPPVALVLTGNTDLDSEELIAWELGYRFTGSDTFSVDLNLFFNDYDDLRSAESLGIVPAPPVAPPALGLLIATTNGLYAESYGLETSLSWQPSDQWQVNLSYTYLDIQMHKRSFSSDFFANSSEGLSPENQLTIGSYYKLKNNLQLNLTGRYVDELPTNNTDAYFALDANLQWQFKPGLSLSLIGRNLLDPEHRETSDTFLSTEETLVQRELYLKLDWQL
ncbi:MAG: TonB-dependent receptor [Gammaproteobacteria bacterium]|nr:TonB-dependent receptor [Gammaproteobacteria bacterium]MBQ0839939.1 TonB-dependent receptor [Gammaproteobacteria bacterium]